MREQGQVDSLLPILFHNCRDAQTAADVATAFLETAVTGFEEAATSLLKTVTGPEKLSEDVGRFIEGCRFACTANLNWR